MPQQGRNTTMRRQDDPGPLPIRPRADHTLAPLRLFLGLTFVYAGVQKLTDPQYFDPTAAGYIGHQIADMANGSPLQGLLLGLVVPHAPLFGALVAWGELAIGLGTLVGLLFRAAALSGALISLVFFLTASWQVRPYFYGADIVFVFAWLTLLLAGPARSGLPALDTRFSATATRDLPPGQRGKATRRQFFGVAGTVVGGLLALLFLRHRLAESALAGQGDGVATQGTADTGGVLSPPTTPTAVAAAPTMVPPIGSAPSSAAPVAAPDPRLPDDNPVPTSAPPTSAAPTAQAPASGPVIAQAGQVPANSALSFRLPGTGAPSVLVHLADGHFVAFDASCTHAGCPVRYDPTTKLLRCPCHGAEFDPANNAAVMRRPARTPLTPVPIQVDPATGSITLKG
jgi:thiosulfate dehydrogenase [quinone] large subunit